MQNNLKSAFLSFMCKSPVAGLDAKSAREYPAHLAYKNKSRVPKDMHAVERQKHLLASALGYKTNLAHRDYGISKANFRKPKKYHFSKYAICVQNASWTTKQWPIEILERTFKNPRTKRFKLTVSIWEPSRVRTSFRNLFYF